MNCNRCNAALPDDSIFCPYCGTPVGYSGSDVPDTAPEVTIPEPVPVPEAPRPVNQNYCAHCGASMPVGSRFCGSCGKEDPSMAPPVIHVQPPVAPPVYTPPAAPVPPAVTGPDKPKKKKRKVAKIVLPIIAGVLVLALVIGLLTNWFGLYGPTTKIVNAAKKTLESGSFTIEVTSTYDYGSERTGSSTITYEVSIDFEKEDLTIVGLNEDDEIETAIYDGYKITYYNGYYDSGYYAIDISDTIDQIFDAYEATGDFDLEELLEDLDEDLYDEIDDMMRIEDLEKSVKSLYRKLNSNSWLKENAGYSKEKVDGVTVYTFEPDLYDLSCAVMEEFEDAFRDEDDYEDLMDELKDDRSNMRKTDLSLAIGVKSGKLVSLDIDTESNGYSISIEAEIRNIGTTNVDIDTLDEILADAERW